MRRFWKWQKQRKKRAAATFPRGWPWHPFEELEEGEGIQIHHSGYESGENGELLSEEKQEITFTPNVLVPSVVCTSVKGYTARISPLGIRLDGPIFEYSGEYSHWTPEKLIITYTDGTVYQARNTDLDNTILGCYSADGALYEIFNRLVNTENIASVTVNGPEGEDLVFTR